MRTPQPLASETISVEVYKPVGQLLVWEWEKRGNQYFINVQIKMIDGEWWDTVTKYVPAIALQYDHAGNLSINLSDKIGARSCKSAKEVAIYLANYFEGKLRGHVANVA